jgi:hypothetical protein
MSSNVLPNGRRYQSAGVVYSVDADGVDAEQLAADDQFADLGRAGADLQQPRSLGCTKLTKRESHLCLGVSGQSIILRHSILERAPREKLAMPVSDKG